MQLLGFVLVGVGGIVLSGAGFPFYKWQYWAVTVPLILGTILIGANQ